MTSISGFLAETHYPKILIVDDKEENLISMETLLARLEVETVRALSGEEALAKVLQHDFALALVDIQMPGMDGFELAELLHGNAGTQDLPIIFVSAVFSGEVFQIRGIESGAIDFIEKPIVPQVLAGKVRLFVELYEHRRRLLQESFRGIIGSLSDGVMLADDSGELLMANPAAVDMIGPGFASRLSHLIESAKEGGQYTTLELAGLDGVMRVVEVNASVLEWQNQRVWAVSMRDVTERQKTQKQLESANSELKDLNEELKSFAYTVSHDLRAPLITIGGFVGLLEKLIPPEKNADAHGFVEEINSATQKMNGLLSHLLEYSRIGRIDRTHQEISMASVVDSVARMLKSQLEVKRVELVVEKNLPFLVGEKVRLEQLLQNLLENAIKYMGDQPQPQINVGIASCGDGARALFVKDNGSGIDPKHHQKAFNLFSRVDTEQEGSGVGLALVKKIAKIHGGDAWLESGGAGKGTTVWVQLPFLDDDSTESPSCPSGTEPEPQTQPDGRES